MSQYTVENRKEREGEIERNGERGGGSERERRWERPGGRDPMVEKSCSEDGEVLLYRPRPH